jgi:hypothetical protein
LLFALLSLYVVTANEKRKKEQVGDEIRQEVKAFRQASPYGSDEPWRSRENDVCDDEDTMNDMKRRQATNLEAEPGLTIVHSGRKEAKSRCILLTSPATDLQ